MVFADQFQMLDIGASGGVRPEWRPLIGAATFMGFEPNIDEVIRQNKNDYGARFFPAAISGVSGKRPFYKTRSPFCSGLTEIGDFCKRFPNYLNSEPIGQEYIDTITVDDWCDSMNIETIDFIKLDVEGSEAEILSGAQETLSSRGVLGVLSEYWVEGRTRKSKGYGVGQIERRLHPHGFCLYDQTTTRYPRSTLPVGKLIANRHEDGTVKIQQIKNIRGEYGQLLTGDLLFFRDPVEELEMGVFSDATWTPVKLAKLITLFDIYNYPDSALEVLSVFSEILPSEFTINALRTICAVDLYDSKTKKYLGKVSLSYEELFKIQKSMFLNRGGLNHNDLYAKLNLEPSQQLLSLDAKARDIL